MEHRRALCSIVFFFEQKYALLSNYSIAVALINLYCSHGPFHKAGLPIIFAELPDPKAQHWLAYPKGKTPSTGSPSRRPAAGGRRALALACSRAAVIHARSCGGPVALAQLPLPFSAGCASSSSSSRLTGPLLCRGTRTPAEAMVIPLLFFSFQNRNCEFVL